MKRGGLVSGARASGQAGGRAGGRAGGERGGSRALCSYSRAGDGLLLLSQRADPLREAGAAEGRRAHLAGDGAVDGAVADGAVGRGRPRHLGPDPDTCAFLFTPLAEEESPRRARPSLTGQRVVI